MAFASVATIVVVAALGTEWREIVQIYRFVSTFEAIGANRHGRPQYRHRRTGARMVRVGDKYVFKLRGQLSRGQAFTHQVTDRLWFCLDSIKSFGGGWCIRVSDSEQSRHDFSQVVTLPFRGPNARELLGWHFRNSDNTGPNALGPKNVNAPGRRREFEFVLNSTDFQRAHDALRTDEYMEVYRALVKGRGSLNITRLELGNLLPGQSASIEEMEFEVELAVPLR